MGTRTYKATVYITVENDVDDYTPEIHALQDYCSDAVALDLDTEEYGNPYQVGGIVIDWDSLKEATGVQAP